MDSTRRARLSSVIQQELSRVVPREIKDPRVPTVTFTAVEVTEDAGLATVYVSILGGAGRIL
jgi:ribosome-binding factor A